MRTAFSLFLLSFSPTGCLDATAAITAGDAADAAADLIDEPACPVPGVLLEHVARETGPFALGRCGALVYWNEHDGRALRFLSGTHGEIASYPDPNGYAGEVRVSPSRRHVVASSLRSDLGFGDAIVGSMPERAPFTVDGRFDFDAGDRYDLAGEGIFFVARTQDEVSLSVLDLESASVRPLVALDQSRPESFRVTGDGKRIIIVRECEIAGCGPCVVTVVRVLDGRTGALLLEPSGWRNPQTGAGPLVAAESDAGAVLLDAAGGIVTVPGQVPWKVMADHVITTDGASFYRVRDGAVAQIDGGGFERIAAVFDDGVIIATAPGASVIRGPDGAELARFESGCVRGVQRRDALLFFELCSAPNDELHRFDLVTRGDSIVSEGHDFDFDVDASGTYVAYTYVPLSGTVRELQAGRIPR